MTTETVARLFDMAAEVAARLDREPHLRPQYERIAARARRAQALQFQRDHLDELGAAGFTITRGDVR